MPPPTLNSEEPENLTHVQRYADNLGSSPLMRGKRHPACPRRTEQRLIPAHAEKT